MHTYNLTTTNLVLVRLQPVLFQLLDHQEDFVGFPSFLPVIICVKNQLYHQEQTTSLENNNQMHEQHHNLKWYL